MSGCYYMYIYVYIYIFPFPTLYGTVWSRYHTAWYTTILRSAQQWRRQNLDPFMCDIWGCLLWIFEYRGHSFHDVVTFTCGHDDVIKWKLFPRYWYFVRGIHRSPVNSPHKGRWRGTLMFSLICVWTNGWVNNRDAGDLKRHRVHYDVTVMGAVIYLSQIHPGGWRSMGHVCEHLLINYRFINCGPNNKEFFFSNSCIVILLIHNKGVSFDHFSFFFGYPIIYVMFIIDLSLLSGASIWVWNIFLKLVIL